MAWSLYSLLDTPDNGRASLVSYGLFLPCYPCKRGHDLIYLYSEAASSHALTPTLTPLPCRGKLTFFPRFPVGLGDDQLSIVRPFQLSLSFPSPPKLFALTLQRPLQRLFLVAGK